MAFLRVKCKRTTWRKGEIYIHISVLRQKPFRGCEISYESTSKNRMCRLCSVGDFAVTEVMSLDFKIHSLKFNVVASGKYEKYILKCTAAFYIYLFTYLFILYYHLNM